LTSSLEIVEVSSSCSLLFSLQTDGGEKQTFSELQDNSELTGVALQLPCVPDLQWYFIQTVFLNRPVAILIYLTRAFNKGRNP